MGTSDKFNIILSKSAYKYLQRLPQNIRKRIATIIEEELSQDPFSSSKIKPLHGKLEGFYRYKEGDLRIIYKVEKEQLTVYIYEIGPRGDIYKK